MSLIFLLLAICGGGLVIALVVAAVYFIMRDRDLDT